MKKLVVTNPFGGHEVGDEITDERIVNDILANEHAHHVVQVEYTKAKQPEASKEG